MIYMIKKKLLLSLFFSNICMKTKVCLQKL